MDEDGSPGEILPLCRELWVAPGETAPGRKYSSIRPDGSVSKAAGALKMRNIRARKRAAEDAG